MDESLLISDARLLSELAERLAQQHDVGGVGDDVGALFTKLVLDARRKITGKKPVSVAPEDEAF
jgi:hypothetical protein